MRLYVERFNRHDWNGLLELISADARLRVVDAFSGRLSDSPYFGNYERWSMPWKMAIGEVDGEPVVIVMRHGAETYEPYAIVRITLVGQQIGSIVDYAHCPWMIPAAASITVISSR
jgi:RNA polymerase sigma-70 factor (ECF subfamily)